jgi:hypothetical protein
MSGHSQQQCDWSDDLPSPRAAPPHILTCRVYTANRGDAYGNLPYRDDLIEEQGILGLKVGLRIHKSSPVGFFL